MAKSGFPPWTWDPQVVQTLFVKVLTRLLESFWFSRSHLWLVLLALGFWSQHDWRDLCRHIGLCSPLVILSEAECEHLQVFC